MEQTKPTGVPNICISDLEKLSQKIRQVGGEENVEISFEFIIASLFPTSWNNIQSALNRQYTLGYIQGQNDMQEEYRKMARLKRDSDCYCE